MPLKHQLMCAWIRNSHGFEDARLGESSCLKDSSCTREASRWERCRRLRILCLIVSLACPCYNNCSLWRGERRVSGLRMDSVAPFFLLIEGNSLICFHELFKFTLKCNFMEQENASERKERLKPVPLKKDKTILSFSCGES